MWKLIQRFFVYTQMQQSFYSSHSQLLLQRDSMLEIQSIVFIQGEWKNRKFPTFLMFFMKISKNPPKTQFQKNMWDGKTSEKNAIFHFPQEIFSHPREFSEFSLVWKTFIFLWLLCVGKNMIIFSDIFLVVRYIKDEREKNFFHRCRIRLNGVIKLWGKSWWDFSTDGRSFFFINMRKAARPPMWHFFRAIN